MFHDTEAFSGFSIKNAEETKRFYGDVLGMEIAGFADPSGNNLAVLQPPR